MRYMLFSLVLPICFIANDYFGHGVDLRTLKAISMYFAVIVIVVPIHAYKKHKIKSKNYLAVSNREMTIVFGEHSECIPISEISRCSIFNICGNKNFVIYHSNTDSRFLLNGLNDEFVSELSKYLNNIEVKKASFYEILKYLVRGMGNN